MLVTRGEVVDNNGSILIDIIATRPLETAIARANVAADRLPIGRRC